MSNREINAQLLAALRPILAALEVEPVNASLADELRAALAAAEAEQQQDCFSNTPPASEPIVDLIEVLEDECWTLRCVEVPGFDESDVAWQVVGYYMEKPQERLIASASNPRAAILEAIRIDREVGAYGHSTPAYPVTAPQPAVPDGYALDAARYQWLLHQAWFQEACDRFDFDDGGLQNRFEKCVDEMIDRTMLAAAKGNDE